MSTEGLRLTLILIGLVVLGLIWFLHRPAGQKHRKGASRRHEGRREPIAASAEPEPEEQLAGASGDMAPPSAPEAPRQPSLPEIEPQGERSATPAEEQRREPTISLPLPRSGPDRIVEPPAEENREQLRDTFSRPPKAERPAASQSEDGKRIVTLYLKTRGEQRITGAALLDAAIKAGLRFGEMKIFHRRHRGAPLPVFSMANIERPGNFDPAGWNLFESRGVSLFTILPGPVSALDAWDAMLATGERLSTLLECDLLDDRHEALTRQRIAEFRDELREFDRLHPHDG